MKNRAVIRNEEVQTFLHVKKSASDGVKTNDTKPVDFDGILKIFSRMEADRYGK